VKSPLQSSLDNLHDEDNTEIVDYVQHSV